VLGENRSCYLQLLLLFSSFATDEQHNHNTG
jgi:hypothetical protein